MVFALDLDVLSEGVRVFLFGSCRDLILQLFQTVDPSFAENSVLFSYIFENWKCQLLKAESVFVYYFLYHINHKQK